MESWEASRSSNVISWNTLVDFQYKLLVACMDSKQHIESLINLFYSHELEKQPEY